MIRAIALGVLLGAFASPVAAQDIDPEQGGVYIPEEPVEQPPTDPPANNGPRAWYEGGPTGTTPEPEPEASGLPTSIDSGSSDDESGTSDSNSGGSDHHRMVGRVAVGFMGSSVVPIGTLAGGGIDSETVTAPALGIRYWFEDVVGIDVGIGVGVLTGSVETGPMSVPTDDSFALVLHAGVPLALYHSSHYTFLLIPEINIGFAGGTVYGPTQDQDRGREGLLFQLGGRIGTEIHFGFMDIPNLTLQASVGLYLDYSNVSVGPNRAGTVDGTARNQFAFGTTVIGEPWDIFLGALTALYYF